MNFRWKKEVWDPFLPEDKQGITYLLEDEWGAGLFEIIVYDNEFVVSATLFDENEHSFSALEDAVAYCETAVRLLEK